MRRLVTTSDCLPSRTGVLAARTVVRSFEVVEVNIALIDFHRPRLAGGGEGSAHEVGRHRRAGAGVDRNGHAYAS